MSVLKVGSYDAVLDVNACAIDMLIDDLTRMKNRGVEAVRLTTAQSGHILRCEPIASAKTIAFLKTDRDGNPDAKAAAFGVFTRDEASTTVRARK